MNDLNIKNLRKKLGVTQKQLAEMLGVSANTIQNWEYGGKIPKSKYPILMSLTSNPHNVFGGHSDKNGTIKERLICFIKYLQIGQGKFEAQCGLANGYVNNIRRSITPEKLHQIALHFPDLNTGWLLTGEGEMLRRPEATNVTPLGNATHALNEDAVTVRFFEVTPTATFQEFCQGAPETPDTIGIIPLHGDILDDSACVFQVSGSSMSPQIQPGARVLCREIPPTRWHTLSGGIIVIAYADAFVIKRLVSNHLACDNYLVLASDNPAYPEHHTVQLSDIRAIFRATRLISSPLI